MRVQQGKLNTKEFFMNQTWDNGAKTVDKFKPKTALFSEDGTLLAFDLEYSDGYIASIALVPKEQWIDDSFEFLEEWLIPLGLRVATGSIESLDGNGIYDSLVKSALRYGGGTVINFLTGNIRKSNLVYVNIYNGTIYKHGVIQYSPDDIFRGLADDVSDLISGFFS